MSIIKLSSGKSSAAMIKYCSVGKNNRDVESPIQRCTAWTNSLGLEKPEHIEDAWSLTRSGFGKNDGIQYHHASLSLDPSDKATAKMSDTKLLKMAEGFVQKHAPGHDYAIFIHRDKEHPHAHIMWNSVSHETGKKFHSSKDDLKKAMEIKDSLDQEYGLKITERTKKSDIISDKVRRLHQRDPDAYIWTEDLKSRVESAISGSANFEDYRAKLGQDGVTAISRGKNGAITYSFSDTTGTERKCRENRLGADYARERIEQLFERNREQSQGNPEQHQSTEKSAGNSKRNQTNKGTDRFSAQLPSGSTPDTGPESHGPENNRTRLEQQVRKALDGNGGLEGTGFTFRDLFERQFPTDRGITISAAVKAGCDDYEYSGSSAGLRKEHDYSVISLPESAENGAYLFRNIDRAASSNRNDSHYEDVKSAIKELQNAASLRQYLEVRRKRDTGISADEPGRIDRNDQAHKSELVRYYCRVDYESRATATGCERQFREATERSGRDFKSRAVENFGSFVERVKEVGAAGKEFLSRASAKIRDFGEKTTAAVDWYNSHRDKILEHDKSITKFVTDTKSLADSVREVEKAHNKIRAPKISVSIDRDDDSGIGM